MRHKFLILLGLIILALTTPSNCYASNASESGKVGDLIQLSLRDLGSTANNIYNDLANGESHVVSYSWNSSKESATRWNEKSKTYAFVKFTEPGTYTIKYAMKYSFAGSSRNYEFSGSWTVTIRENGPTGVLGDF